LKPDPGREKTLALLSHAGYGTSGITSGTQVFDFSPILLANLRLEEAFLAHVPVATNDPIYDPVGYWQEDVLVGDTITSTGTLATGATALNMSAADALKLGYNATSAHARVGAVLQIYKGTSGAATATDNDNGEQFQITAWASSTQATITRAYGQTADPGGTYPTASKFKLVAWPVPEGSGLLTDQSQSRTVRYNLTQIFRRDITVTRNQIQRRMQSLEDDFLYQIDQRAIEMKREMNSTLIFGSPSTSITGTFAVTPANSGDSRTMAGWIYFLTIAGGAAAGATYDNTAEALTSKVVNGMHFASAVLGGNPQSLVVGGKQSRAVQAFSQDTIRTVPDERVRSGYTTQLRTDTGAVLALITDFNMSLGAEGTAGLIDFSRTRFRPWVDSDFFILVAPTFTDGDSASVLAEWSFECRNAVGTLAAHAIHTALTVPS
jgi:hypothetical protein